ncbi:hypothetical protein MASR1M8_16480 [Thermomonas brevis]
MRGKAIAERTAIVAAGPRRRQLDNALRRCLLAVAATAAQAGTAARATPQANTPRRPRIATNKPSPTPMAAIAAM